MAYLYRHIRLDKNEPFYIGIGTQKKRCYVNCKRNNHWHNITDKTEYRVDIIFDDLTLEEAKEKEKEFISLYGKKLNGGTLVNLTDGGDGCWGYKATEEQLEKRVKRMTENNHFKGKKHTPESLEKMRLAKLGVKRPKEGYIKRAEKMKNYVGFKHWNSKPVLDIETGVYYGSVREAAEYAEMNVSTFIRAMKKNIIKYKRV
jgi:hypothetical protein